MDEHVWPAERFEENRRHLRAVTYRMLGSLSEADDAVQEAWLRLNRKRGNIAQIDVIANPATLRQLDIGVLNPPRAGQVRGFIPRSDSSLQCSGR